MSNPFQNIGYVLFFFPFFWPFLTYKWIYFTNVCLFSRNAACLTVVAVASVIVVKSNVRNKKEANYAPPARVTSNSDKLSDNFHNIAEVRPGFPLKEEGEQRERKSIYEGPGLSRETRKKGDKLGFFDRWR